MSIKLQLKEDYIKRKCHVCGYVFTQKSHLVRHLKNQHQIDALLGNINTIVKMNNELTPSSTIDTKSNTKLSEVNLKNNQNTLETVKKPDNFSKLSTFTMNNDYNMISTIDTNKDIIGAIISLKEIMYKQNEEIEKQSRKMKLFEEKQIENYENIEKLKEKPNVTNNILQVVCVSHNDNYLDILTEQLGDFDKALKYIKCCALSNINGDCQLIEKIYLNSQKSKPAFHYLNKSKTKIKYFDEKETLKIDKKEDFARKLDNNLQNSYLNGINHVIVDNLDNKRCPNKFLEEYDIQTWNQHIYSLSDSSYQKKFMNQLNIPTF